MSYTHSKCGQPIYWANRDDAPGNYLPPLEASGTAFIIDESGRGIEVTTYRKHLCDPAKVRAWQKYQAELEKLEVGRVADKRKTTRDREVELEQHRLKVYEDAVKVDCPTCDASVGEACFNVRMLRRDPLKHPHPTRLMVARNRIVNA